MLCMHIVNLQCNDSFGPGNAYNVSTQSVPVGLLEHHWLMAACSTVSGTTKLPNIISTSMASDGIKPFLTIPGLDPTFWVPGSAGDLSFQCHSHCLQEHMKRSVTMLYPYRPDRAPRPSYVFSHFLSVSSLCRCPALFLLCYMFHPSLPQSAVINALLMCYLSRYL
jgi:hypothetical protein